MARRMSKLRGDGGERGRKGRRVQLPIPRRFPD